MGRALANPTDDSVARLDGLESQRTRLLARADSLGRYLEGLPSGNDRGAAPVLQEAERLGEQARDLEVEILLERGRCRSLALQELESLRDASSPEAAQRRALLHDLVDGRLSQALQREFVIVEPDSADGYETLLDKQAYLRDLRDRIVLLEDRLAQRAERLRREQSLLRESDRFTEESRFIDEGGRIKPDQPLRPNEPGRPVLDAPIRVRGSDEGGLGGGNGAEGGTPQGAGATNAPATLAEARATLEQGLSRVETALRATEALLGRYHPPAR